MNNFRNIKANTYITNKIIKKIQGGGAFFTNRIAQKCLSVALILALAVGMMPGEPGRAQVETQIATSHKMFATTEELKNPEIFSLAEGNDDKVGRIRFGKMTNWLIAGWDTAPNSGQPGLVLFSENVLIPSCQFQTSTVNQPYIAPAGSGYGDTVTTQTVYKHHYGASKFRVQLNDLFAGSDLFTDKEKAHTLPSTVTTKDPRNKVDYTTSDTLYALLAPGNKYGAECTKIAAGEADNLIIDNAVWPIDYSWLRSCSNFNTVLCIRNSRDIYFADVSESHAAIAAFKLNMGSVIFASAASALQSAEKFSPIANNTAMGLRLNGSTELAGANVTANGAKLTYTAPANSRLMVIAVTEDGSTYQFSKSIDAAVTKATLNLAKIAGDLKGKTVAVKAWIEKDAAGQLTYATEPISFLIELKLPTPTINDFVYIGPSSWIYDGTPKAVTVVTKPGINGMGAITIKYYIVYSDGTKTLLSSPPTVASPDGAHYEFWFDVAEGSGYTAKTGLPVVL